MELLRLAFSVGERYLYISPGSLDAGQVSRGAHNARLKTYLQQCRDVHQRHEEQRRQRAASAGGGRRAGQRHLRETVGEGLRSSSNAGLSSREAVRIDSRSYDGIKLRRAAPKPPRSSSSASSSNNHLSAGQPHSARHPLSEIYVSGSSSFTDLSTSRRDHKVMVKNSTLTKHSSSEGLGGTDSAPPDHSLPRRSFGRSLESGIAKPPTPAPSLGSSWGGSQSGYDSDTASSATSFQLWNPPKRSLSQSDTSHPPPPPPSIPRPSSTSRLNKSLTRSTEVVNQSTFEPFGTRPPPKRTNSYVRLDGSAADELGAQVADLSERVTTLTMQFIYEKADIMKQLQRACALMPRAWGGVEWVGVGTEVWPRSQSPTSKAGAWYMLYVTSMTEGCVYKNVMQTEGGGEIGGGWREVVEDRR